MLMERRKSCLLLIDVQEKLTPLVQNYKEMVNNCQWLLQIACDLKVPCVVSEQYPKGLGETVQVIKPLVQPLEKVTFSAFRAADFEKKIQTLNKSQMVLIGIETHVCVLQTALDLQKAGYSVFVVVDAVASRKQNDYKYALKRMGQAGIQLVTREMVFFEWIGQAGTDEFKTMSKKYLQGV